MVRGLSFPADSATKLSIVGCEGVYARQPEPIATYLSRGPGPAGTRSFKYDLAGGNAVGSQSSVRSMAATTTAGLSVYAPNGSAGVAYAGYQSPADWSTKRFWVGRAGLTAAADAWKQIDATDLTYTWTQYDLGTLKPVDQADGRGHRAGVPRGPRRGRPRVLRHRVRVRRAAVQDRRAALRQRRRGHDVRPRGLHQHRRHQRLRLLDHRGRERDAQRRGARPVGPDASARLARPGGAEVRHGPVRAGRGRGRQSWTPATRP